MANPKVRTFPQKKLRFQASAMAQIIQLLAEVLSETVTESKSKKWFWCFFVDSFVLKELPTVSPGASKLMYPK